MSVAIKQECKVPAFDYFQNDDKWESHLRQFDAAIPIKIDRELLVIKGTFDDAISNLQIDERDSLKKAINTLNELTKKYLEADNKQFDIEIPETVIDECIALSTHIKTKTQKLSELPGGDKENEINSIGGKISKLKQQLEALIQSNEANKKLAGEEEHSIKEEITRLETQIDGTTSEITSLDINLLDIKAKEKLEEIKIKHYEKLLESNENEFKLKEMANKGKTTFLEVQLKQLEEEFKKNDETEIVTVLTAKFKEKNRAKMKGKEFTSNSSSNVKNKGWLDEDEKKKGPWQIEEKDLYNNNKYYIAIGDILSGKKAISDKKSKQFRNINEKGYTNVLTVDSTTINNNLEKLS